MLAPANPGTKCGHTATIAPDGRCLLCTDAAEPAPTRATAAPRRRSRTAAIERELCRRSFAAFVERFWPLVEPAHPYVENTATSALIATLQAVADGRLRRVLIELPPGSGKSTLLVLYAAWRVARNPAHRAIYASHAHTIAVNGLSLRTRRLVEGETFRAMFGVQLRPDENTASVWATTGNGKFVGVGVGGALTGHRADETVVDDPLNSIDAHSKAVRDTCHAWFGESFSTRVDGSGPIVVVGQRLGTDDLIGRLKASGAAWTPLTLPAEFDPRRRCTVHAIDGSIVWSDPRTDEGELLAPAILSSTKLAELKLGIGSAAFQSQYNANPSSDENAIVPSKWWRFYRAPLAPTGTRRPIGCDDGPAAELPARFDAVVIGADLTFGSTKGDYAVVQVWAAAGGARYLLRQWRKRAGFEEQLAAIKAFAAEFEGARIVIEKAANGAAVIETLAKAVPGVIPQIPVGSKVQRLAGVVPTIESGSCYLPESANYVAEFVEEFQAFPGPHDDQLDCAVWCLLALQTAIVDEQRIRRAMALNTWDDPTPEEFERRVQRALGKPGKP